MDKMKEIKDKDYQIAKLQHKLEWFEKKYGPYIEKRGLKNWKNLFRKPTLNEGVILIMIIMGMFMGWAYQQDTEGCRETLANIDGICAAKCQSYANQNPDLPAGKDLDLAFNLTMSEFSSGNG
jgi:hypothetical protein